MIYGTSSNFTVQLEPKVTFKDWYGMSPYRIDATFDFSKIPKELHQVFLNRLCNEYNTNREPYVNKPVKQHWLTKLLFTDIF
jgi:hypothetical protein